MNRIEILAWVLIVGVLTVVAVNEFNYKNKRSEEALQEILSDLAYAEYQRDKAHRLIEQVFDIEITGGLTYGSTPVTVSAYTARKEECDGTPETTADMTPSRVGVLAVSPDMITEMGLAFGELVLLTDGDESLGVFQVRDKMNSRYRRTVDILHGNVEAARLFGRRTNVTLTRILNTEI